MNEYVLVDRNDTTRQCVSTADISESSIRMVESAYLRSAFVEKGSILCDVKPSHPTSGVYFLTVFDSQNHSRSLGHYLVIERAKHRKVWLGSARKMFKEWCDQRTGNLTETKADKMNLLLDFIDTLVDDGRLEAAELIRYCDDCRCP